MARSRNIKPGFFSNDLLAEIDPLGRLLFAGLWTLADREGRLECRVKRIKAAVLPYDDADVDVLLADLQQRGFVVRYEVGENEFIQVLNFTKHQTPHHKEPASTILAPDMPKSSPGQILDMPKSSRADSLNLIPDSLNPSTAMSPTGDPLPCPADRIIDAYHRLMPDNPRCKVLTAARRGAIKSRWLEAARLTCKPFGYTDQAGGIRAWEEFFEICAGSDFLTGKAKSQPGMPPFRADIDFLFSPKGFAGCLENKYHREAA